MLVFRGILGSPRSAQPIDFLPKAWTFATWADQLPEIQWVAGLPVMTNHGSQRDPIFRASAVGTMVSWSTRRHCQAVEVIFRQCLDTRQGTDWLLGSWQRRPKPPQPFLLATVQKTSPVRLSSIVGRVEHQDLRHQLIATVDQDHLPDAPRHLIVLTPKADTGRQWLVERHPPDQRGHRFILAASSQLAKAFPKSGLGMYQSLLRHHVLVPLHERHQAIGLYLLHDVRVRLRAARRT